MPDCGHYTGELTTLHPKLETERFLSKRTIVCRCGVAMVFVRSNRNVGFNPVLNVRQRAAAIKALAAHYRLRVVAEASTLRAYPRFASPPHLNG